MRKERVEKEKDTIRPKKEKTEKRERIKVIKRQDTIVYSKSANCKTFRFTSPSNASFL